MTSNLSKATSACALRARVDSLVEEGVDRFDVARFHYINALLTRAQSIQQCHARVADQLVKKAEQALGRYMTDFEDLQQQVLPLVEQVLILRPECETELNALLSSHQLMEVRRLVRNLLRQVDQEIRPTLSAVVLNAHQETEAQREPSIDEQLLNHEAAVQQLLSGDVSAEAAVGAVGASSVDALVDLKSYHRFKGSSIEQHADYLVRQAVEEAPKNAGPLNSHRLAVDSIETLRALSPAYLKRFVFYMDSLLWLEKASVGLSREAKR